MLKVKKGNLIQFTNLVNECCELIDDSMVEEFLTTPHGHFNKSLESKLYAIYTNQLLFIAILKLNN